MPRHPLYPGEHGKITLTALGNGRFQAFCRVGNADGKSRAVRATGINKAAAERELLRRLGQQQTQKQTTAKGPQLASIWEEWFERASTRQDWTEGTRIQYRSVIQSLVLPTFADIEVGKITTPMIAKWLDHIVDATPGRGKQALTVMNGLMNYATNRGHIQSNPAREVQLNTSKRARYGHDEQTRIFTPDEIGRLRHAADDWDTGKLWTSGPRPDVFARAFFELGLALGPRIGELLALKWSDIVDEGDDYVEVTIGRTLVPSRVRETGKSYNVQEHTKTRTNRRVRVSRSVLSYLQPLPRRGDFIFSSRTGTPLTQANVGKRLRPILAHAGIEGASFHAFRRTIATAVEDSLGLDKAAASIGDRSRAVAAKHYVKRTQDSPDYREIMDNYVGHVEPEQDNHSELRGAPRG